MNEKMKFYLTSSGFIFVLGFDMVARKPDSKIICWCDPQSLEWEPTVANQAGSLRLPLDVGYDVFREEPDNTRILIGDRIELNYLGRPYIWGLRIKSEVAA